MSERILNNELLEEAIRDQPLAVVQIGSLNDELRLILASLKTGQHTITIRLTGVATYYYKPTPTEAIQKVYVGEPGSFAFRLGQKMRDYTQVQVDGLIALARSVSFRPYETDEDLNFPG